MGKTKTAEVRLWFPPDGNCVHVGKTDRHSGRHIAAIEPSADGSRYHIDVTDFFDPKLSGLVFSSREKAKERVRKDWQEYACARYILSQDG